MADSPQTDLHERLLNLYYDAACAHDPNSFDPNVFEAELASLFEQLETLRLENSLALELMTEPQRVRFHEIVASRESTPASSCS